MKDVIYRVPESWNNDKAETLCKPWNKLKLIKDKEFKKE